MYGLQWIVLTVCRKITAYEETTLLSVSHHELVLLKYGEAWNGLSS